MFIKHADGPRQRYPADKKWPRNPQPCNTTIQESPWLWFTLPELGFPLLSDEYRRLIHPDIEEYMRDIFQTTKIGNKSMTKTVGVSIIRNPPHWSKEKSRLSSTFGERKKPSQIRRRLPNRPQKEKDSPCHMRQEILKFFKTWIWRMKTSSN